LGSTKLGLRIPALAAEHHDIYSGQSVDGSDRASSIASRAFGVIVSEFF